MSGTRDQELVHALRREDSFLDLYMDYTRDQESPESFHLWTGITVLAASMGRKCYINKGYYRLYPNFFVVLVAGSAICRKTTAINLGIVTPNEISLFEGIPTTKVISGRITGEKMLDEINESQTLTEDEPVRLVCKNLFIHSRELSVFLTRQAYGQSLIEILTDLYDCPKNFVYKTRHSRSIELNDVFVCILAATTPDGVAKSINPGALNEGFGSRVLWVYEESSNRINALPELTQEQRRLEVELKRMLEERSRIGGEFTLSDDARTAYKNWYSTYHDTPPPDKFLAGVYGRKHDHLLRVGMVLAGNFKKRVIEPNQLDASLSLLDNLEIKMPNSFREMGGDELTHHLMRARAFMLRYRRLQHSELLRRMYPCDGLKFRTVMDTLIQSGEVRRDELNASIYEWTV